MADGAGGGIGKAIIDSASDIAKDLTVNLGKGLLDQLGGTTTTQKQQNNTPQGAQMSSVQKNMRMAQISRNFRQMTVQRRVASQQVKQQEDSRKQMMQEEKQRKIQREEGGGDKKKGFLSKIGEMVRTSGKGEKRGQKLTG